MFPNQFTLVKMCQMCDRSHKHYNNLFLNGFFWILTYYGWNPLGGLVDRVFFFLE